MRRMLITGFAILAGYSGWTSAADAQTSTDTDADAVAAIHPAAIPVVLIYEAAPDALLSAATMALTTGLKQNLRSLSPGQMLELLESTLLPLFDFRRMTQLAMARHWRHASAEQQIALTAEFRKLLVHADAGALANYREQTIEYKPLRMGPGETDVTVRSAMKQPDAERTTIDYDMEKTAGGWKVYDVRVDGFSRVTAYRSPFAQTISDDGIDGLIKALAAINRHVDSAPTADEGSALDILFMYQLMPGIFGNRK